MKCDAGYTLVEALAALGILGLVMTSLVAALHLAGLQQTAVTTALSGSESMRSAQAGLDRLLNDQGPFYSHERNFEGDAKTVRFLCGAATTCAIELSDGAGDLGSAELTLRRGGAAQKWPLSGRKFAFLSYSGSTTRTSHWPPEAPERQSLRSITISADESGELPLLNTRIWTEQRAKCAFDPVLQDCR